MKEIKAIIQPFMLERVLHALAAIRELPGVTVSPVTGWGRARGEGASDAVHEGEHRLAKKTKLEIVVSDALALQVAEAISESARTGNVGDGKIFLYDVQDAIKIRTGGRSEEAL
ncbi:MAG: P-II family nitrogen regulator [Acidimicrobiia bacterium]|nr:P-II family nitrogen regulator [Acidimicrobiia bacterium]